MKQLITILLVISSVTVKAQKIDSIYFNLYTDSLKKGVHNYINVDGKTPTGSFLPLMADEIIFTTTAGKWDGNSLIIDRDSKIDSVIITASLKEQPSIKETVTVYIKKIEVDPVLKTEKELIEGWQKKRRQKD